jgi:polyisoprenoid-binding protein YceI
MTWLTRLALPAVVTLLVFTHGALCAQQLVADKSLITFVVRQMGVPVEGRFSAFKATLAFDPKKPESGSVQLQIDLASAQIGDAETTKELRKPEWFNTARHNTASFGSTAIKGLGGGKLEVIGALSIKGSSHNVVVPVTLEQAAGLTTANGQFTLKRIDYKIGEGEWADIAIVANDVQVRFKLVLQGVAPL